MAHEIENMFSVRETPWHKLGTVVSQAPSALEAMRLAGLDWTVVKKQLQTADGQKLVNAYAIIRESDGAILGDAVGPNWTPLQNYESCDFFNPFVESGLASFETAGSLQNGRRIWILAALNKKPMEIAKDDKILKYLLLSNSHDGSIAVRVGFTPIRAICANTVAMAHRHRLSKLIRFKHTRTLHKNLDAIQETVNLADAEFEATAEQYRALSVRGINQADLRKYVKTVFEFEENDADMSTRSKNILDGILQRHEDKTGVIQDLLAGHRQNVEMQHAVNGSILESIVEKFEDGRGQNLPSTKGTWYTAYNAIAEHLSYERGHNADTRLNQLWFGQSATLNNVAFDTAMKMSGV